MYSIHEIRYIRKAFTNLTLIPHTSSPYININPTWGLLDLSFF